MTITRRELLARALAGGTALCMFRRLPVRDALAKPTAKQLAADPRRPQFHLLPAANWMNDPNGPIYWHGKYHMFYQYNPDGAYWGDMHWAHATSPDMVHWTHLPIALSPTPGGPDAGGCFTGTTVLDAGKVTVNLHRRGCSPGESSDDTRWTESFPRKSVPRSFHRSRIEAMVEASQADHRCASGRGMHVTGFRDPSPWRQGDWWYMTIGSGFPHRSGAVLLYRIERPATLGISACPGQRRACGTKRDASGCFRRYVGVSGAFSSWVRKHVLIFSTQGKTHWKVGDLDLKQMLFHPEKEGILDYGSYYAAKTQLDASGQRILWGWILEARPLDEYRAAGWAGMMSLPRVLTLSHDGDLSIQVAPAAEVLRGTRQALRMTPNEERNAEQIGQMTVENCCGEILCTFKSGTDKVGLSLLGTQPDRSSPETWLTLQYDAAAHHPISLDGDAIPVELRDPQTLEVHIYIDGSVAEVFVNKQITYTKRFYYPGTRCPNDEPAHSGQNDQSLQSGDVEPHADLFESSYDLIGAAPSPWMCGR